MVASRQCGCALAQDCVITTSQVFITTLFEHV